MVKIHQIPFYWRLPKFMRKKYFDSIKNFEEYIERKIEESSNNKNGNNKIEDQEGPLSLIEFFEQRNEEMSKNELMDQIKGILFAGVKIIFLFLFYFNFFLQHETTANTICFTLYLILKNKEILKEVIEEVDTVLPNKKVENISQIKQLVKLEACIKEALRLRNFYFHLILLY